MTNYVYGLQLGATDAVNANLGAASGMGSTQFFSLPASGGTLSTAPYILLANSTGVVPGGAADMLSLEVNPENNLTSVGSALISTWNHCTSTSANYALNLPAVASNYGRLLGIVVDPSSTYTITVTGNASENIDGQNTRIMWAKESAVLYADQASGQWIKVAGKAIPMRGTLGVAGNQTFSAASANKLTFTNSIANNGPTGFQVSASQEFVILRPGEYFISYNGLTTQNNSSITNVDLLIYNGSNQIAGTSQYEPAAVGLFISGTWYGHLAANATLYIYGYYTAGSFSTTYLTNDNSIPQYNYFSVIEVPTW